MVRDAQPRRIETVIGVRRPRWGRHAQQQTFNTFAYLLMSAICIIVLIPALWLISTSLKGREQSWAFPPQWIPNPVVWDNFAAVFRAGPFGIFLRNTLVLIVWNVLGEVWSNTLVAYGFARLRFRGRDFWFMVLLATMMIPGTVTMIPTYILYSKLGWLNTYLPLTVPAFFGSAFSVFLLRQYMMTIPLELDDAARMDGCGTFRILYSILLPLCKPPLTIIVVYSVLGQWNSFFSPLIYLNDIDKFPIGLGLAMLRGQFRTDWNVVMAASLMSVIPAVILYYLAQDKLIGGIASVGLKG
jgi:multiple sugar transport system permease protein